MHDNKKLINNPKSKLGKKIHSNDVAFDNKCSISRDEWIMWQNYKDGLNDIEIREKNNAKLKEEEERNKLQAYKDERDKWKNDFMLCKITKDQFYDWLCFKVPQKKSKTDM